MGLENVVTEVRRAGESEAAEVVQAAKKEAQAILAAARDQVQAYERRRQADAERDAEQLLLQARSRAGSEARKVVLAAEAQMRQRLRGAVLQSFSKLDAQKRADHIRRLVQRARAVVPAGRVWAAKQDLGALDAQDVYEVAGTAPIAGGIIVESADNTTRLDLSYETLLQDMWRDVLRSEAALFA